MTYLRLPDAKRPPAVPRRAPIRSAAGFSLAEFLFVGVIIGVMASVTVPRFVDGRNVAEQGYSEELVAALAISRKVAMASGCPVRVEIDTGGYRARQQQATGNDCRPADGGWSKPVVSANGQFLTGTSPLGVTASPGLTLVFDPSGKPDLSADLELQIGSHALLLRAGSGYVEML